MFKMLFQIVLLVSAAVGSLAQAGAQNASLPNCLVGPNMIGLQASRLAVLGSPPQCPIVDESIEAFL